MSILIDTLLDRIKHEFTLPEPTWENNSIDRYDLQFLGEECNKDSEFDPTNKRKKMFREMINGNKMVVKSKCKFGQVFAVFDSADQLAQMPWGLWGRILRLFSEKGRKRFKVFLLATTSLRIFPPKSEPIIPENINGGYTYRCNPETILIYRAEDATRVLIHELQHSCCLDKVDNGVDLIEAETEAWAELLYIAMLSQGHATSFHTLLNKQSEWMIKQNAKVKKHMKHPTSREFPWRYTIGKEDVWRRWGILKEYHSHMEVGNSLRLTYPPSNELKEQFKVIRGSTIL